MDCDEKMQNLDETEEELTTKCRSNKESAAAASATTLPQTAEPPHSHASPPSSSSSRAPKDNIQRGLSTKVALSRLYEEIEEVLLLEEKEQRAEG